MDFGTSFQRDGLLTDWGKTFDKLLLFLTRGNHIKDRNVTSILNKMVKDNTISESK